MLTHPVESPVVSLDRDQDQASELTTVLDVRVVCGAGGGPEKTILNSPRHLAPMGYRMLCAYMHPPGDPGFEQLKHRARSLGAPLLPVPDRGPCDWRVMGRLLQICRVERVAIWHGHDYKSNLLGLLLRRFWPMRLVTTVHGWVQRTRRTPLYYAVDRLCLPRYESVICVSEDLYQRCLDGGVSESRCLLVENGIDTQQYGVRPGDLGPAKARLGADSGRPLIGSVGRLSDEKGFDVLIRAADRLLVRGQHDLGLVIAGEGADRPRLEGIIAELDRRDRFRLLGYHPAPVEVFNALDVFVLSSYREGLPNVLLEAMALGVPVVATRVAGIPRLIEHERNGLLVDPGDPSALAAAVERILDDYSLRSRLAAEGRRTVESCYSFGARMHRIGALYDELLGRD
jgi:glycosyltransferase involved in cell wall biosynthesis